MTLALEGGERDRGGVDAGGFQAAVKRVRRDVTFETAAATARAGLAAFDNREMSDLAGIAEGTGPEHAVLNSTAAEADAEEDVEEVLVLPAGAIEPLAERGSTGIDADEGRQARALLELRLDRHAAPALHGGRPDEAHRTRRRTVPAWRGRRRDGDLAAGARASRRSTRRRSGRLFRAGASAARGRSRR